MELIINSPAYFKEHYGIDDDVYRYCREVSCYFKDKEYSDILHTIGIIPVIAPQELYDGGSWKEHVEFRGHNSTVAVTIRMDFSKYYYANPNEKIEMMKEAILRAVKKCKTKGKFDFESFEKDFMAMTESVLFVAVK